MAENKINHVNFQQSTRVLSQRDPVSPSFIRFWISKLAQTWELKKGLYLSVIMIQVRMYALDLEFPAYTDQVIV